MKKTLLSLVFAVLFTGIATAQEAKKVSLNQTTGAFEQTTLHLKPGDYIFEVSNEDVDHEVGFVLVPKGATSQKEHIKAAYLKETIKEGETSTSSVVTLKKGEYEYFCPLNPTPHYTLIVD